MAIRKRKWTTPSGEIREKWVCEFADGSGKRRLKTFKTKKAAEIFESQARVDIRAGVFTADGASVSVKDAGDLWLKSATARGLERSTVDSYRQALNFHIVPLIGAKKLSQLSAPAVRSFEDALRDGSMDGKSRSPAMVKKVRAALSILLNDAQERGLVNRNVVSELRNRRNGAERRQERRQRGKLKVGVDIPATTEITALIAALVNQNPRHRAILITAIFTGLRASELRGLRWEDVDFTTKEIRVHQRADRYNVIGKPKSESGERVVPVPPMALNVLREWKLKCPEDKKNTLGLAFPTSAGTIVQLSDIVNRGLIPAQLAAGVVTVATKEDGSEVTRAKYSGLHALRHFFASWCINRRSDGGLELPLKVVQERMGHSTIQMTADRYGHLFPRGDDHEELAAAESLLWIA
jgi:integrase